MMWFENLEPFVAAAFDAINGAFLQSISWEKSKSYDAINCVDDSSLLLHHDFHDHLNYENHGGKHEMYIFSCLPENFFFSMSRSAWCSNTPNALLSDHAELIMRGTLLARKNRQRNSMRDAQGLYFMMSMDISISIF